MVSWEPREESVSRTGQLVIPPRAHYNSRELLLPQVFTCACTHVCSLVLSLPPPASLPFLPLFLSLPSLPYVTRLLFNASVLIFLLSRVSGSPSLGLLSTEFKQKSLDNVDFSDLFFFTISLPYILQKLSKKYTCPMREKGGV